MILDEVRVGGDDILGEKWKGLKEFLYRLEGGGIWIGGLCVGIGEGGVDG